MEDKNTNDLLDYKIFTFNGEPKIIQVDFDRSINHKRNLYNVDWSFIDVTILYPSCKERNFDKPIVLEEMLDLSKRLSNGIRHVRVDFYLINDKIYFGEMTFYHGAGNEPFNPSSYDEYFGSLIILPNNLY